jgi:hypothetical protein
LSSERQRRRTLRFSLQTAVFFGGRTAMGICTREKDIVGTSVSTAHSLSLLLVRPLVRMWFSKSLSRQLRMRLKLFVSNLRGRYVALKDPQPRQKTPGLQLSIEKRSKRIDFVKPQGYRDENVTFLLQDRSVGSWIFGHSSFALGTEQNRVHVALMAVEKLCITAGYNLLDRSFRDIRVG